MCIIDIEIKTLVINLAQKINQRKIREADFSSTVVNQLCGNIPPLNNLSSRKFNLSELTLTDTVIDAKPSDFKSFGILHARRK